MEREEQSKYTHRHISSSSRRQSNPDASVTFLNQPVLRGILHQEKSKKSIGEMGSLNTGRQRMSEKESPRILCGLGKPSWMASSSPLSQPTGF